MGEKRPANGRFVFFLQVRVVFLGRSTLQYQEVISWTITRDR
jgi:hypothetical protein